MTTFPVPLERRFADTIATMQRRITLLESRSVVAASGSVAAPLTLSSGQASASVLTVTNTTSAPSIAALVVTSQAAGDRSVGVQVTGDTNRRLSIDSTGKLSWGPGATAGDTNLYRSAPGTLQTDSALIVTGALTASGQVYASDPVNGGNETWHSLPLTNGWSNYGATHANARYRLLPFGIVEVIGRISHAAVSGSSQVSTALPAAYIPHSIMDLDCGVFGNSAAPTTSPVLTLDTSGVLTAFDLPAGTTSISFHELYSLDA